MRFDMCSRNDSDFIMNIVGIIMKGCVFNMGAVNYGTLYVMVNNGIIYTVDVSDFFSKTFSVAFRKEDIIPVLEEVLDKKENKMKEKVVGYQIINRSELLYPFIKRIEKVFDLEKSSELIYDNDNMREDKEFEDMINASSSDGEFRCHIDTKYNRTFICLTKSLFSLSKPDTVKLKVFYIDNQTNLAKFIINKKKLKIDINMYCMFIDMIRGGQNDSPVK